MATDPAKLEAQLDALEESLFRLDARAGLTGTAADAAAQALANLYAQQAAGVNVYAGTIDRARGTLAALTAEAGRLGGSREELGGLLEAVRSLTEEAAGKLAPAFKELVKLAGENADAERKRAAVLAEVQRLEALLARQQAPGSGVGAAERAGTETKLEAARGKLGETELQAGLAGGNYERAHAGLVEKVGEAPTGKGVLAGAQEALGGLVDAVQQNVVAFGLVTAAVYGSVQAYSPATVMQFQQALKDLSAVFGVALTPVMEGLTGLAREVGGALLPIMEALSPVMEQLTQTVLAIVLPVVDNFASVLQSLVPLVVFVGEVLSNVGTITRVAGAFMAGWIELLRQAATALGEWLGGLTGVADPAATFTSWLETALKSVGEAAILAAGYLAKLIGGPDSGFLAGMIKSLQPKPALAEHKDITGLGAASQAQVTTGAAFEKSALAAAFIATGKDTDKKDTSAWLADVVKELQAIKEGKDNKADQWVAKARAFLKEEVDRIVAELIGLPGKLAGQAGNAVLDAGKHGVGFLDKKGDDLADALVKRFPGLFGR